MEIAFLGSSSSGNSTLICGSESSILIDAGLSARTIEKSLDILGRSARELSAILLSHEHMDHCRGAGILSRKHDIPVMANLPTFAMSPIGNVNFEEFTTQEPFDIGEISIMTYPIPHNAAEPVCFTICDGKHSIGYATDLGKVTTIVSKALFDKDLLIIEANHDEEMLWRGSYPEFLKKSISSSRGHLSNRATAKAVRHLVTERTQAVVLAHLSEDNNTPERAETEVRRSLARAFKMPRVQSADRLQITPYIDLQ